MEPTALIPRSSAGLVAVQQAASQDTLAGYAKSIYQNLLTLQSRFNRVPTEVKSLTEDVKILYLLLAAVKTSSKTDRDTGLPPELRYVWERTEISLRADLESLHKLVYQFEGELSASSTARTRILASLRYVSSDGTILELRRALKIHIQILNLVDILLARRQLITFQASFSPGDSDLVESISDEFGFYTDEMKAIQNLLMELRKSPVHEHAEMCRLMDHMTPTFTATDLNLDTQIFRDKRSRKIVWRWSMYNFPIGILTTEVILAEEDQQENHSKQPKKKIQITFKFRPPSWLMKYLLQVDYTIGTKGNMLPYWQRTQCGELSLLPTELRSCLDEGDCLAAADCISRISMHDILQLCKNNYLNGVPVPNHIATMKDAEGRTITVRACSMSLDACVGPAKSSTRHIPQIYAIYTSFSVAGVDQGSYTFAPQHATFHQSDSWLWLWLQINDYSLHTSYPFFPYIGMPVTRESFQHFIHNIGQHLDPQGVLDFPTKDRWWVSALIHGVPHFRAFMSSHFASFRSQISVTQIRPRILDSFRYPQVIEEIKASPRLEQLQFVSFVCVFGTGKMLLPLKDSGFDFDLGDKKNSFLRAAVLGHNFETFDFLVEALQGTTAFRDTLNQELLDEFLSSPFCNRDDGFLNRLLLYMPPSIFQSQRVLISLGPASSFCSALIPNDLLTHEMPYRLASKAEVTFHLIVGLHNERSSNLDALTMAVFWAVEESLDSMLGYQSYLPDAASDLLKALAQAERNVLASHPRVVPILNAKAPQYPLIKTIYSVQESEDARCCLLLIQALKKMQAFPERKFAKLMIKLAQITEPPLADISNRRAKFLGKDSKMGSPDNEPVHENEAASDLSERSNPSSPSTVSTTTSRQRLQRSFASILNELAWLATASTKSILAPLGNMDLLEYGLLVFGTFASFFAAVEYVFWAALVYVSCVPKPSNTALSAAGLLMLACVCTALRT